MKKTATDRYYSIGDLKLQTLCDQLLHAACRDFIPLLSAGVRAETLLALSNLRDSFAEYPLETEVAPALNQLTIELENAESELRKSLQYLCKAVGKELGTGNVYHARLEAKRFTNQEDLYRIGKRTLLQADLLLKDEILSSSFQDFINSLKQQVEAYDKLLTIYRTAQQEYHLATCEKAELGNSLFVQLIALSLTCSGALPANEYIKLYEELQLSSTMAETAYSANVA